MKTFGKYTILEEIGKGGFATVYRAHDRDLDRDVALKVLDPLLMRDPVWVKRFRREARAVARFKHPHIVSIYEIGQAEGVLYIAMELAEGGNLDARIQQLGHLSWEETVRLVKEMASALDYAHGKGVLHRDLKPANVLLDPETGSVLTDFGFVRILADNSLSVSLSGGVVGTPAYIPPEIWNGKQATPQTDIYALGCIVYEMLQGEQRFRGETQPAVMMAHFNPPPLSQDWPEDVPPGIVDVLARAMAQGPEERYASAGELAEDLAELTLDRLAEPYAALEEPVVAGLEQRALAGMAQEAKEAQAAEWREAAEQALAAGDLDAAELAIAQWLQLLPGDERVLGMKRRVGELRVAGEAEKRRGAPLRSPGDTNGGSQGAGGDVPRGRPEPAPKPDSQSGGVAGPRQGRLWAILAGVATLALLLFFIFKPSPPSPIPAPTIAPTPANMENSPNNALGIGSTMISEKDGMEMVYVPAGEFIMGSPDGEGDDDEHPQHTVHLDAFWIDRTEVTNAQYQRCVAAGACQPNEDYGSDFNGPNQPVVGVSWYDAKAYCEWAGKRLPTEAEWEKAVRGVDGRTYPWGNEWDVQTTKRLNFADKNTDFDWSDKEVDDGYKYAAPVGSYPAGASPYGVLDMAGNVWEWMADWYDANYYASSPARNPTGPASGDYRVLRGGSWLNGQDLVRSVNRGRDVPDNRDDNDGFRCVRPSP